MGAPSYALTALHPRHAGTKAQAPVGIWLMVLMLFLLPLERVTLPLRLTVADFALVLLTMHSLGSAWRDHRRLALPLVLPAWIILVSSLVATLTGFAHLGSVIAIAQEIYLFVWFVAIANHLASLPRGDLGRLLKYWAVFAMVQALAALMGMFEIGPSQFYVAPEGGRELSFGGFSRGLGTYRNPNATAAYLSVSVSALLGTSWPVWLRVLGSAWLLLGIFASGSMGALLSTLGGLGVLLGASLIIRRPQRATLWGGLLGVGAGILASVVVVLSLWPSAIADLSLGAEGELFSLTVGRVPRSAQSRMVLVASAWSTFRQHPWGSGPNSSVLYLGTLHNDYVAFLFERGPLGAIGWLWIVVSTLIRPLKVALRTDDARQRWCVLALDAGFLACAVNALTHEISHFRQVWVLLAFLYALCSGADKGLEYHKEREGSVA